MLNKSERFKVLKFLRIQSIVGPLPIHVDLESWTVHAPSLIKKYFCSVSYVLVLLHILYKNGSFYAYFFVPHVQLHQLMIHAVLALSTVLCSVFFYVAYIKDPRLFAAFASLTLRGKTGGTSILVDQTYKVSNELDYFPRSYRFEKPTRKAMDKQVEGVFHAGLGGSELALHGDTGTSSDMLVIHVRSINETSSLCCTSYSSTKLGYIRTASDRGSSLHHDNGFHSNANMAAASHIL